jgi:linoleoyl-CoA desaturase
MERTIKPSFAKHQDAELFQQLRKEVNEMVSVLEPRRKIGIKAKAILFPAAYLAAYATVLLWGNNISILFTSYCLMGLLLVLNFLNIIHEAVHGTLFNSKKINAWYIYFFDLLGANSFIFKVRHVRLHHNYPNVMGWDSDFEQSDMARVFPHGDYAPMHKYQHIYLPLLYPMYLFNWLLIRDFKDFFNKNKLVWKVTTIPTIEYVKLFVFKALFIFYTLFLPKMVLGITWGEIISAFLIMMFTASIVSLVVLLSPHASLESEFPQPDVAGNMPTSWFRHQLMCTNDIKEDNSFTRVFMGCFNYHIAHHLFPSVNHVYYPEVTQVIEKFAKENDLPYRKFPLATSLRNHYLLLKNNAFHENIFEETM